MSLVRVPVGVSSITLTGDGVLAPTAGIITCSVANATIICKDIHKPHVVTTNPTTGAGTVSMSGRITSITVNGNVYGVTSGISDSMSAVDLSALVYNESFKLVQG